MQEIEKTTYAIKWPYMEKIDESEVFFYIVDVGRWENNQ